MCRPSTHLIIIYFPTYVQDLFPTKLVTKVKSKINLIEIHPQLSNNRHPGNGELVDARSLFIIAIHQLQLLESA